MAKNKPDWLRIKTEYTTTTISYRNLADKHGVSFNTLQCRAKRERWAEARKKNQDIVEKNVRQDKAVLKAYEKVLAEPALEKESRERVDKLVSILELNNLAAEKAKKLLADDIGPGGLKSITGALKDINDIARNALDRDTNATQINENIQSIRKMLETTVPNRSIPDDDGERVMN